MPREPDSIVILLLQQARGGDAAAREALFAKCRNYVELIARAQVESWMRSKVDASDLVQQTLLEAHRAFERFEGESEGEWLAWLRQILLHNTHDFIRRYRTGKRGAGRERSLQAPIEGVDGSFVHDPQDDGDTPSQILQQREREIELADAIARLSAEHQEVVLLRNLQRLPFDEVAARMGRSRPAVQMLWMRAIKKLEQTMSGRD